MTIPTKKHREFSIIIMIIGVDKLSLFSNKTTNNSMGSNRLNEVINTPHFIMTKVECNYFGASDNDNCTKAKLFK